MPKTNLLNNIRTSFSYYENLMLFLEEMVKKNNNIFYQKNLQK